MTDHDTSDVIIVGGSCGGLACAHALLGSGKCRVTVLERAPSITAAGAVMFLPCKASRYFFLAEFMPHCITVNGMHAQTRHLSSVIRP